MKMMIALVVLISCVVGGGVAPAHALKLAVQNIEIAQDSGQVAVAPSEAANIAKDSVPGSRVLSVKLLPSGVYAVTLKVGGSVTRVMVDATSGAVT